ncbi:putative nuclease HARBI1 [Osmerus eperlanus]|uniref:putative nuclease HARBI1 n=1 Tax=Osmerus eperlanus TaxID=29151 RepID=UPI002E168152
MRGSKTNSTKTNKENECHSSAHSVAQQVEVKQGFFAVDGFPNTIGAVDCTHIAIKAPSLNEFNYVNRKGFHSINVQIISDAQKNLLNVVARWPGGTHDSFILQNSNVGLRLEEGAVQDGWLIGDRGYPLKPWLMTPLTNPVTAQERAYNAAHSRTRSIVERTIGTLKGRWLCLSSAGGALQYTPEKACNIVMACCVLHNMAIKHGIPLVQEDQPDETMPDAPPFQPPNALAVQRRMEIIQRFRD